jgi:hypothetical protein
MSQKIVKTIQLGWNWDGDIYMLKGFNLVILPDGKNPNQHFNEVIASVTVSPKPAITELEKGKYRHTFTNLILDEGGIYSPWIQAVYENDDSDWVNMGGATASDDGESTIVVANNPTLLQVMDMANDDKITPQEKSQLKKEWDEISNDYVTMNENMTNAGVADKSKYLVPTQNLVSYLNKNAAYTWKVPGAVGYDYPELIKGFNTVTLSADGYVNIETFRKKFSDYYKGKLEMLEIIKNKGLSDIDDGKVSNNQVDVFNALTNNGVSKGFFLQNNDFYVNADYIAAGVLADVNRKTVFDLANGTLRFGNSDSDFKLKYDGTNLIFGAGSIVWANLDNTTKANIASPTVYIEGGIRGVLVGADNTIQTFPTDYTAKVMLGTTDITNSCTYAWTASGVYTGTGIAKTFRPIKGSYTTNETTIKLTVTYNGLTYSETIPLVVSKIGESAAKLTLELPNGNTFQGNSGLAKRINVKLRLGETEVTSSAVIKWHFNGTEDIDIRNSQFCDIYPVDVLGNLTVKVIATYNSIDYEDSVSFADLDDVYQVTISGSDKIKNSSGSVTLTAIVYRGSAQILNGFRCRWSDMSTTPPTVIYEGINTTGTLIQRGVEITLTAAQINEKLDLLCEVSTDTVEQELELIEETYIPTYDSRAYATAMSIALS